jgi:hypothetical protein
MLDACKQAQAACEGAIETRRRNAVISAVRLFVTTRYTERRSKIARTDKNRPVIALAWAMFIADDAIDRVASFR